VQCNGGFAGSLILHRFTLWLLHVRQDGFLVEGTGAHTFQDVDLSDDWADFDEKTGNAVSVMDLEWRFSVRR
jgi:Eukaryotic protein of unknown function (DUF866)